MRMGRLPSTIKKAHPQKGERRRGTTFFGPSLAGDPRMPGNGGQADSSPLSAPERDFPFPLGPGFHLAPALSACAKRY